MAGIPQVRSRVIARAGSPPSILFKEIVAHLLEYENYFGTAPPILVGLSENPYTNAVSSVIQGSDDKFDNGDLLNQLDLTISRIYRVRTTGIVETQKGQYLL